MKRSSRLTLAASCATLTLTALTSISAQVTAGPAQGPDGNFYEVVLYSTSTTLDWDAARTAAANHTSGSFSNGHLATITAEDEDLFIETLRQQAHTTAGIDPHDPATARPLWVGGSQAPDQSRVFNGWSWVVSEGTIPVNRLTAGYSNWASGEPNDYPSSGVENNDENYLAIGHLGHFGWNDRSAPVHGYVVEYEVDPVMATYGPFVNPDGSPTAFVMGARHWTWEEARSEARWSTYRGFGGKLATLEFQIEDDWVEEHRPTALSRIGFNPANPASHPALWVGGYQTPDSSGVGQNWSWDHGRPIPATNGSGPFANWLEGEPNDWPSTGTEDNEENHLAIGFLGQHGWNDSTGTTQGYVAEYDLPVTTQLALRSSRYDGSGGLRFPHDPRYNRNVAMAVEAWVYREDGNRCETIISQGFASSFWFGFCSGKLRFYRSGSAADADRNVPANQWTHVAASYDGSFVRFYINGESAGERGLANLGTGPDDPVFIGCNDDSISYPFRGSLDEVRLWSTTRSRSQVRDAMGTELSSSPGLEAAWRRGGTAAFPPGTVLGSGAEPQRVGILPKKLVVPRAATQPTFDGNVDRGAEYLGAEQLVLRYSDGPNTRDAIAHLVHTRDYLYVGIEGARLPASGAPSVENVLNLFLDADATTSTFDPEMMQGSLFLQDATSGFARVKEFTIVGPGGIPNTIRAWGSDTPPSFALQSRMGTDFAHELASAADVEFRIHRSRLGDFHFSEPDRLAITHASNGGPNGDAHFPDATDRNDASTWNELHYHPFTGSSIPTASVGGWVINPATGLGIGGIEVSLDALGVETTTTLASGRFDFSRVPASAGTTVRLSFTPPAGAQLATATTREDGIAPQTLGLSEVIFPACDTGDCYYSTIFFNLTLPLPQVSLTAASPDSVWPPVPVRSGSPGRATSTRPVRVELTNPHNALDFFLVREDRCIGNDPTAPGSGCTLGVDYFPLSSTLVSPPGGTPFFELVIPGFAEHGWLPPTPHFYRVAAHDTWSRPANNPTNAGSWRYTPAPVWVTNPPYAEQHGFAFDNISDGHDIDDYRAAFYGRVCDPTTMVGFWAFFPVYLDVLGGGECLGMVATAQQFARRTIPSPSSLFHPEVIHGNGFPFLPDRQPYIPAVFDIGNPCSPRPQNVWALIKANHGVQLSSAFVSATIDQFEVGPSGVITNMATQLDRIRTRPLDFMVCIRNGSKGHCVQPVRVVDVVRDSLGAVIPDRRQIEIYDPNHPDNASLAIDIDLATGNYTYDGGFTGGPWTGSWLLVHETDPIWDNSRHIPSLDTVGRAFARLGVDSLLDLLQIIVSGDAEPLVTSSDGGQLGWDGAGNFIEKSSETYPVPNFNWIPGDTPPLGHYPVAMYHRLHTGCPDVALHCRGEDYHFNTSHQGNLFQLEVTGSIPGESDDVELLENGLVVLGLSFTPQSKRHVSPRVALCQSGTIYPAAIATTPVEVPAARSLGLRLLPGSTGVQLLNDTGSTINPSFFITLPEPGASQPTTHDTPKLPVPDGATVTVTSLDGATFARPVFNVDNDSDGTPEQTLLFSLTSGEFAPFTSSGDLWLSLDDISPGSVTLSFADPTAECFLETTQDLSSPWKTVHFEQLQPTVTGGVITVTLPVADGRNFFRLRKP